MARRIPAGLPILKPGRHRRPEQGACVMELTAVLSGERFSDHPRCTDPTLAAVARAVNDYSSEAARQRLSVFAPELSTAAPAGVAAAAAIVRRCVLTAMPYSSGTRRRVLLVALFGADRASAGRGRGFDTDMLDFDTQQALLEAEHTMRTQTGEASAFLQEWTSSTAEVIGRGAPRAVELAVMTVAAEAVRSDDILYSLLADCLRYHRDALPAGASVSAGPCPLPPAGRRSLDPQRPRSSGRRWAGSTPAG